MMRTSVVLTRNTCLFNLGEVHTMDAKHRNPLHSADRRPQYKHIKTYSHNDLRFASTQRQSLSHFKILLRRLFIVFVICFTFFITQTTNANFMLSTTSSALTMEVRVSDRGFSMRETITISVAFPDDPLNKRYHDWLQPCDILASNSSSSPPGKTAHSSGPARPGW